ncbi:MAG TPA: Spy/CpxP family protein refolding chaperone [Verrucomicrobiae bacterium]|nr:Spy/CpxP family protein refolding chaperone [Verrucomicrobiae bacterium]
MKPTLLTFMAAALMACPALVNAQNPTDKPEQKRHMGPEERLKVMTEKLSLTAEQQEKVKAIYEKYGPQMKEFMSKGRENLTEQDRTKMRELMKSQNDEINAILTPEQQEKMKEMHKKGPGGPKGGKRDHGDASKN